MIDPIKASKCITENFTDYIRTSFDMADEDYRKAFGEALARNNAVAKGPYLEISGAFRPGRSLSELINDGIASRLFYELEPVGEKQREIKLERPLYAHQEAAFIKAKDRKNLVVTTGTGSGKTECFLIPVINSLLGEIEAGTLDDSVRAIIIYPMNALATDQIKRMRALLKGYPSIRFGLYNGNTEHDQNVALRRYRETNGGSDPIENEAISREVMQKRPPHILITNYSMLEYMMLRPKDDAVFSGAKLRYIILDEAHIYKGATGIETSLLMRRLRARISVPENVRYILTSATLGDKKADEEIVSFAEKLCGANFSADNIIRSEEIVPSVKGNMDFPPEMYSELEEPENDITDVLKKYGALFSSESDDREKLYELCLHDRLYGEICKSASVPTDFYELHSRISRIKPITERQLADFISLCSKAVIGNSALIKVRYHMFIRTLEGAYITLGEPKQLFLERLVRTGGKDQKAVFEAAVCTDCGRIAVSGRVLGNTIEHCSEGYDDENTGYFLLRDPSDTELFGDDEGDEESSGCGENDYLLCPACGALVSEADYELGNAPCSCKAGYVRVVKSHKNKCPACGFGSFRRFYLGAEAATAVLATELYEQLPSTLVVYKSQKETAPVSSMFSAVAAKQSRTEEVQTRRQFLCFSDSRSEAAFFAKYMETSYEEFLRRRGIWHIAGKLRKSGVTELSCTEFVDELKRYFLAEKTFAEYDKTEPSPELCLGNAWVAVLNEMFNARRRTSLVSMGVLSFEFIKNDDLCKNFAVNYKIPEKDARALLELLVLDAVYSGAIDAGDKYYLTPEEREYIFFSPYRKLLVESKNAGSGSSETGWCRRIRKNGNYFPNSRIQRLVRELGISEDEADGFLKEYWKHMLGVYAKEGKVTIPADAFRIHLDMSSKGIYICNKCGRVTPFNVNSRCSSIKCSGVLRKTSFEELTANDHYARLYSSEHMQPLYIKEHTAQLAKDRQTVYQQDFVNGKINALSCSTTFEMGVDLGSLETVYMRNVPPSPANYVQRAGRAGRGSGSAAFVLTYAKLSSHDLTYYEEPVNIISGKIRAPIFEIENEKIVNRHIFAVALSAFLNENPDVYGGDDLSVMVNSDGFERLCDYLDSEPPMLKALLKKSIPSNLHESLGIDNFSWKEKLTGDDGLLRIAVEDFRNTVSELEKMLKELRRRHDDDNITEWSRRLKNFRASPADGTRKKSLIEFLVRNNILPKYGFPVDTVELCTSIGNEYGKGGLQLSRDLQQAVAEYAPGSQIIADGSMYTSRYIRRNPGTKNKNDWEIGYYCEHCPVCSEPNFTKLPIEIHDRVCVHCGKEIPKRFWQKTLEPRRGFISEYKPKPVPMRRPERDYKTDDCYIGDSHSRQISKKTFETDGLKVILESTANDSLVVVGRNEYFVCPVCGYSDESIIPEKHKNPFGYDCPNHEKNMKKYRLSHDFKTDVAKITFKTPEAADNQRMLSVLYALLEGLSRELEIERTDIKGCLHKIIDDGKQIYSVVLYDAVAGGAGHVRRIVTDDGEVFRSVIQRAVELTENCTCDTSCYKCIRNYYNQKIHDILDRKAAYEFLKKWCGKMEAVD